MTQARLADRPIRWNHPFNGAPLRGDLVSAILSSPTFAKVDESDFPDDLRLRDILANDARITHHKRGDIIYQAGSYHTSLFVILNGAVSLQRHSQGRQGRTSRPEAQGKSILGRYLNKRDPQPRNIPQSPMSVSAALVHSRSLRQYEIFGELEALTRSPGASTAVAAAEQTVLLEIRWSGFRQLLLWSDVFRARIDGLYRQRAILEGLQASGLFDERNLEALQKVARHCTLERFGSFDWSHRFQRDRGAAKSPGSASASDPAIVQQGSYLEDVLVVFAGHACEKKSAEAGDRTIAFLKHGDVFGLKEIMGSLQSGANPSASHSLYASGYCDVIRVPACAIKNVRQHVQFERTPPSAGTRLADTGTGQSRLEFVAENRLANGTKTMVIDTSRCVNCDDCVQACAATHDNVPRFRRQGKTHDRFNIASACMHCADPVCLLDCPTNAIHRDSKTGSVVIDEKNCIGCGTCSSACPYDNIFMMDRKTADGAHLVDKAGTHLRTAVKCDLCAGQSAGPACMRACPHDAISRVDLHDDKSLSEWLRRP